MASKNKLRVTLTVKLLVMFMVVTIISSLSVGLVSYKNAAKGLTQSVYTRLNAASIDVVSKVVEINRRHFPVRREHFAAHFSVDPCAVGFLAESESY